VLAPGVLDRFSAGPLSFEREVFPALLEAGERMTGHVHEGVWTDLGTPERLLAGQRLVLDGAMMWPPLDDLKDLGVLEQRPAREGVLVGEGVRVAVDARLDAPVVLGDGVSIGSGAAVGPHVVIAAGAHVGDSADISDSLVCEEALVAQRAVLSGSLVARAARVAPGADVSDTIVAPPSVDPGGRD
jgi:mannose-1-phosphate guanylyltransferase